MASMPTVKLADGKTIPILGYGTWQCSPEEAYAGVKDALEAGYRHIDCAYNYQNQDGVGKALTEALKSGLVKREDLFITSKCWLTFYTRERAQACVKRTLKDLGLDYLDLMLVHWPFALGQDDEDHFPKTEKGQLKFEEDLDFVDTYRGLEDCVKAGLVKSIGVSNFNSSQLAHLMNSKIEVKPVMHQFECHPWLPQNGLIELSRSYGMQITAYCPLGSTPVPGQPRMLEDPVIVELAKKHNKTPAQVLLRFHVDRDTVVIPRSTKKERIIQNLNIFDFKLSGDEIKSLEALSKDVRFCPFADSREHRHYPFHLKPY